MGKMLKRRRAATGAVLLASMIFVVSVAVPAMGGPKGLSAARALSTAKKALQMAKRADKNAKKALSRTPARGAQGPIGPVGAQGPAGSIGAQGPASLAGGQGPGGAQGPAGAQGPTGEQGPAGTAGGYVAFFSDHDGPVVIDQARSTPGVTGQRLSTGRYCITIPGADSAHLPAVASGVDTIGANGVGGAFVEVIQPPGAGCQAPGYEIQTKADNTNSEGFAARRDFIRVHMIVRSRWLHDLARFASGFWTHCERGLGKWLVTRPTDRTTCAAGAQAEVAVTRCRRSRLVLAGSPDDGGRARAAQVPPPELVRYLRKE